MRPIAARVGLVFLAVLLVGACATDESDPSDITPEGTACMRERGFDSSALLFLAVPDGSVGYGSKVRDDLSDLDALLPKLGPTSMDASSALAECLDSLAELTVPYGPQEVAVTAAERAGILACINAAPNADQLLDITIKKYDDGSFTISHTREDGDLGPSEVVALDDAVLACLLEAHR